MLEVCLSLVVIFEAVVIGGLLLKDKVKAKAAEVAAKVEEEAKK